MSGLAVPKHVYDRMQREKQLEGVAGSIQRTQMNALTSDDFVSSKSVREQLGKLTRYIAARREADPGYVLPRPAGWRILALILTVPEMTDGGLELPAEATEARAMTSPQGIVIAVGPSAYQDRARFAMRGGDPEPWVVPGDRIIWKRYDISTFQIANGQKFAFMNDTQPVAMLDRGWPIPE